MEMPEFHPVISATSCNIQVTATAATATIQEMFFMEGVN